LTATATPLLSTLSLHDALPISHAASGFSSCLALPNETASSRASTMIFSLVALGRRLRPWEGGVHALPFLPAALPTWLFPDCRKLPSGCSPPTAAKWSCHRNKPAVALFPCTRDSTRRRATWREGIWLH